MGAFCEFSLVETFLVWGPSGIPSRRGAGEVPSPEKRGMGGCDPRMREIEILVSMA